MWGYLFRYPGLVVLHDAQVHQARAQSLLGGWTPRRADYTHEFAANHPDAPRDLALLIAAGLGGSLFGHWPLVRLVLQAARLAAVHSPTLAARLAERYGVDVRGRPDGRCRSAREPRAELSAGEVRARHGLQPDARRDRRVRRRHAREAAAAADRGGGRLAADIPTCTCCWSAPPAAPLRRGRRRAAAGHRRAGSPRRVRAPTPTCRRTCRRPTSARACAGPPTARRRPRGCG